MSYPDAIFAGGKGINLEVFNADVIDPFKPVISGQFRVVFTTGLTTGEIVTVDRGTLTRIGLFRALAIEYDQCWIRDAKRSGPICHRKNMTVVGMFRDITAEIPTYFVSVALP